MKVIIVFTDGRADRRFDSDALASRDPFAWDGEIRQRSLPVLEGYDQGVSASMGATFALRRDLDPEAAGLRLDVGWANTLVCGRTELADFGRDAGGGETLKGFTAEEECGRALVLADAGEARHIGCVYVDGEVVLERRHGRLCDASRALAARRRLEWARTPGLEALYGCNLGPSAPGGQDPLCRAPEQACGLHELARWARPELYDGEASRGRMPAWDEAAICAETGYPPEAWWRLAVSEWFRPGGFYSGLPRGVAAALTLYPAMRWYRAEVGGGPGEAAEFFRAPSRTPRFPDDSEGAEPPGADDAIGDAWDDAWDGGDLERAWDGLCEAQGLVPPDAYRPEPEFVCEGDWDEGDGSWDGPAWL